MSKAGSAKKTAKGAAATDLAAGVGAISLASGGGEIGALIAGIQAEPRSVVPVTARLAAEVSVRTRLP